MPAKKPMTHQGFIAGCDSRTANDYRQLIRLRETKCYWIDKHGCKYDKNGHASGLWPVYRLLIETVEPLAGTLGGNAPQTAATTTPEQNPTTPT